MEVDAHLYDEEHFNDKELQEAADRLEEWRSDPANWQELHPKRKREEAIEEDEEKARDYSVPQSEGGKPPSKQRIPKDLKEKLALEAKIEFFKSRRLDFCTFLKRRLPRDNEVAMKYLKEFSAQSPADFANELRTKVATLQMLGGLTMIFGRMCTKGGIDESDFFDRSCDRPDITTEKQRKDQLVLEIGYFHAQLKELLALAKDIPTDFE
jgi:hypothetical protein